VFSHVDYAVNISAAIALALAGGRATSTFSLASVGDGDHATTLSHAHV
jgi:hypothetical protein